MKDDSGTTTCQSTDAVEAQSAFLHQLNLGALSWKLVR